VRNGNDGWQEKMSPRPGSTRSEAVDVLSRRSAHDVHVHRLPEPAT